MFSYTQRFAVIRQNLFQTCKCFLCFAVVLCFMIGCARNVTENSPREENTNSEVNYAHVVDIGKRAQAIGPLKNGATLAERERFVESGVELLDLLKIVLQNGISIREELRPRRHETHGQDTFLHFKPLATLIKESCLLAVEKKDTQMALQNAFLLINLGKSICYGGDSDDQAMGFIFATQGATLLYKYIRTQPNGLDDSVLDIFAGLTEGIELGAVTVARLPERDDRRHKLVYEKAVEIQSNRVFVMIACLDMCRVAYELERHRMALGKYPLSLQEVRGLLVLPIDPWGEVYAYSSDGNSYQLYSKGIDKVDNGGYTPEISVLVSTGQGDIDVGEIK